MINQAIQKEILNQLNHLEKEENIQILYACESGSRAWGFPSADSDYDVRFIYLRKTDWYLSIDEGRDVIEQDVSNQLDLNGWDLKKVLKLFRKSNPPLFEWLGSPIVYFEKYSVVNKLRALLPEFYSPVSCMHHYFHMAEGNYRQYLKGDRVWIKKYFYVLRPILACKWIEQDLGPVPTEFNVLVNKIIQDEKLKKSINTLVFEKKEGNEFYWGQKIPEISEFIDNEIERLKDKLHLMKKRKRIDFEKLNDIFRSALVEVWG
jgi:predicted nucleotidyltransferase